MIQETDFTPILGTAVRITITEASAGLEIINELEVYSGGADHVYATASSAYNPTSQPDGIIDGEVDGNRWDAFGGWNDKYVNQFPDWVQVNFSQPKQVREVTIYTLKNDYNSGSIVTSTTSASAYGIRDFDIQLSLTGHYYGGATVASVTGNTLAKRTVTFTPTMTRHIRVRVNDSNDHAYSRVVEVQWQ